MSPEPPDKFDAATAVVVNGPVYDRLHVEPIVGGHANRPTRGCLGAQSGGSGSSVDGSVRSITRLA